MNRIYKGHSQQQKYALSEVVELMRKHHLGVDDVSYAWRHALPADKNQRKLTWVHFFYYVGALCIFSGVISYYTVYWRFISTIALSITFGLIGALSFFGGAYILQKIPEVSPSKAKRYPYALLGLGAVFQVSGLFLSFNELSVLLKPETVSIMVFGVMGISAFLGILQSKREPFIALSIVYLSLLWVHLFDRFDFSENIRDMTLGLSLCCLAYYFFSHFKSLFYRVWYIVGSILLQLGVFDAVFRKKSEILFVFLVGSILFISTKLRQKTLFFSATIGLLLYVNTLIYRYLAKSFNVPMLFIIAGFFCIMIGLFLNKLYRQKFSGIEE